MQRLLLEYEFELVLDGGGLGKRGDEERGCDAQEQSDEGTHGVQWRTCCALEDSLKAS